MFVQELTPPPFFRLEKGVEAEPLAKSASTKQAKPVGVVWWKRMLGLSTPVSPQVRA